jgi:hypothetical protein
MNDRGNDTQALDGTARSAIIRTAAGALFVGMLLGIGASALGRPAPARESAAQPTPHSAEHARITEYAEAVATF